MDSKRIQLTLFVPAEQATAIEQVRRQYNPIQYALIPAHVTLCREDELTSLEAVLKKLEQLDFPAFTIPFTTPIRFDSGKGLLLPALEDSMFQELRKLVLKGIVNQPRTHAPHLTLMHPRNSTCTDPLFKEIRTINLPDRFHFNRISLIEQFIGGAWAIKKEWALGS